MLVVLRKIDESLVIGESIVVTVVGIQGDKVKVGIEAPEEVRIRRGKLNPSEIPVADSEPGK